jgi:glycerol dehydrogenase
LEDLGLGEITLAQLRQVTAIATQPQSDIHRLPFTVSTEQLAAAMVSTVAETSRGESRIAPT